MMRRREFLGAAALAAPPPAPRHVGILVLPEYIQVEGIDRVIDNLVRRARATAVCTSPYLMEPADEKTGSREPPIDAGAGSVRLLDRPLWGKRELFVRTAPSYAADPRLYAGLRYQPAPPGALTAAQPTLIRDFLRAAKSAGLRIYFQVQAAIPPGYRVQFGGPAAGDRPTLPNGIRPTRSVSNNGSLASPHIRAYTQALLRDLARAYPDLDGLRVDWPEYPPYFLDDAFLDFSPPAAAAASTLGFDFETMRAAAARLYGLLHGGLTNRHLEQWLENDGSRFAFAASLLDEPKILEWLRFKATLVEELIRGFRSVLSAEGKQLVPNAFPPPFSLLSGMDFSRAARHCDGLSVKLYTMHWPMILRFWAEALLKSNPGLSQELVVAALARWMDLDDQPKPALSDYRYPEPGESHTAGTAAMERKLRQARSRAGQTPIYALAHGYGPTSDFARRLHPAWSGAQGLVWVNRYGYLSDEKLEAIGAICR